MCRERRARAERSVAEAAEVPAELRAAVGLGARKAAGVRLGRPVTLPQQVRDRVKAERDAGKTYAAIAADLNTDGVPTARAGATWYPATVRAVINSLKLDHPE